MAHQLVDVVSQYDENVLRSTSARKRSPPTTSAARSAPRTVSGDIVPVLCGTAFKNKGVQPLLDAVVDYLPSPLDIQAIKGLDVKLEHDLERQADDDEPSPRSCSRS